MRQVVAGLIEENKAQTSAHNNTQDDPGHQVFDLRLRHGGGIALPQRRSGQGRPGDQPAKADADDIGQRIPAQGQLQPEERDRENLGRDIGEGQDV